eukprot:g36272.t1
MMIEGRAVDVVCMDFSKAFNKVPHNRLIHKVKSHEIRNELQHMVVSQRASGSFPGMFQRQLQRRWHRSSTGEEQEIDVEALEKVQKRFTKMLPDLEGISCEERLDNL